MDKLAKRSSNELIKFSKNEFLKKFAVPKCQMMFMEVKTVKAAVFKDLPTLSMIKRAFGAEFVLAYIETWLYNLNDYFNKARKFNPNQISETAKLIYSDYYALNVSEINIIMARIKKVKKGDLYQSIDGSDVLPYFSDYAKERITFFLEQDRFNVDDKFSIKARADIIWKNKNESPALKELYEKFRKPKL